MTEEFAVKNARIVLPERMLKGGLLVRGEEIAAVDEGPGGSEAALDFEGDYLIAGLVELHTDNLEKHARPRPNVHWPILPAVLAHDAQLTAAGITTVYDALSLGHNVDGGRTEILKEAMDALRNAAAHDLLRADHRLHLRCEVSHDSIEALIEPFLDEPLLGLVSLMDHTPGQRQFIDVDRYRRHYKTSYGYSDTEIEARIEEVRHKHALYSEANRRAVADAARKRGLTLASHDDASEDHVSEAADLGATIAEFPTTMEAASAAHRCGMITVMGAPNVVRGLSHSGNVSARALAEEACLDALSSDYMPVSLLHGAFLLADQTGIELPAAVAMITKTPAEAVGLSDRGAIEIGRRADFIRVARFGETPVVRQVWRAGRQIL